MKRKKLLNRTERQIDKLVELYKKEETKSQFTYFTQAVHLLLSTHPKIKPFVHTVKSRIKDSEHLKAKLVRKAIKAREEGGDFDIKEDNLFERIHDLAGVRLLHLYTGQISDINMALLDIFNEQKYNLVEGPVANTWDNEYKEIFKSLSMKINERETMYTSVHYVVASNDSFQTKCEIQVRTLMEEVWGEVDHMINYPVKTDKTCCEEQIKVLARTTSSCTRLVDSIFKSYKAHS